MLILTRHIGESIVIDNHIVVRVNDIRDDSAVFELDDNSRTVKTASIDLEQGKGMRLKGDIIITVVDLTQRRVTIGVSAPREVLILRGELSTKGDLDRP